MEHVGTTVVLCGWIQKNRKLGGATFIDLRDRYGIRATGEVIERESKNKNLPTGDIEIRLKEIEILNRAITPPFTIEDETDGGDELRMKYRYLDLRRNVVRKNLELRHRMAI